MIYHPTGHLGSFQAHQVPFFKQNYHIYLSKTQGEEKTKRCSTSNIGSLLLEKEKHFLLFVWHQQHVSSEEGSGQHRVGRGQPLAKWPGHLWSQVGGFLLRLLQPHLAEATHRELRTRVPDARQTRSLDCGQCDLSWCARVTPGDSNSGPKCFEKVKRCWEQRGKVILRETGCCSHS